MLAETKTFIGKSLQPARPVRHLPSKQASAIAFNIQTELPSNTEACLQSKVDRLSDMTEVKILTQTVMPHQPNQHESEAKKERIKYSRDFLLKLSSVSLSLKKPKFLPDHPIVLEKPEKSNPFTDMCKK
uniref:Chromosome 8 open reading frame 88 n=1 Tax=Falco tinnunculus TaxID=100819 RepID=A0A8C4XUX3_FALTI